MMSSGGQLADTPALQTSKLIQGQLTCLEYLLSHSSAIRLKDDLTEDELTTARNMVLAADPLMTNLHSEKPAVPPKLSFLMCISAVIGAMFYHDTDLPDGNSDCDDGDNDSEHEEHDHASYDTQAMGFKIALSIMQRYLQSYGQLDQFKHFVVNLASLTAFLNYEGYEDDNDKWEVIAVDFEALIEPFIAIQPDLKGWFDKEISAIRKDLVSGQYANIDMQLFEREMKRFFKGLLKEPVPLIDQFSDLIYYSSGDHNILLTAAGGDKPNRMAVQETMEKSVNVSKECIDEMTQANTSLVTFLLGGPTKVDSPSKGIRGDEPNFNNQMTAVIPGEAFRQVLADDDLLSAVIHKTNVRVKEFIRRRGLDADSGVVSSYPNSTTSSSSGGNLSSLAQSNDQAKRPKLTDRHDSATLIEWTQPGGSMDNADDDTDDWRLRSAVNPSFTGKSKIPRITSQAIASGVPHYMESPPVVRPSTTDTNNNNNNNMRKNVNRREARPWTLQEMEYLKEGYAKYSSDWRRIQASYPFAPYRTNVDLKDKVRQMKKTGQITD